MKLENKSKNNGIYNLEACCKRFQQTDYEKNNKINKEYHENGITFIALVVTILFSYDEKLKCSNSKGFLLQTI